MLKNRVMMFLMAMGWVALSGCGIDPNDTKKTEIKCQSDSDCASHQRCRLEEPFRCLAEGCEKGSPTWIAPEGVCEEAKKPPVSPQPSVCSSDSDCKRGERCLYTGAVPEGNTRRVQGRCAPVQVEPPPTSCYQDSDCGANERCELTHEGGEIPPHPGIPGSSEPNTGTGTSTGTSTKDGDTPTSFPCMPAPIGRCVPKAPAPKACQTDADCGRSERCEHFATCAAIGCPPPPPSVCVPRDPQPEPRTCQSDADCLQGEVCEGSVTCAGLNCPPPPPSTCVLRPEPRPEPQPEPAPQGCESDADCQSGQRCEHFATCAAIGCPPPPPSVCVDNTP